MSKKTDDRNNFVIHSLRRASYRWYGRTEALKKARVERGIYECAICKGRFNRKEVQADHIDAVINPAQGFIGLNTFVARLLVEESGWQVLCKIKCHKAKSNIENTCRKEIKAAIKKMNRELDKLQNKEKKEEEF